MMRYAPASGGRRLPCGYRRARPVPPPRHAACCPRRKGLRLSGGYSILCAPGAPCDGKAPSPPGALGPNASHRHCFPPVFPPKPDGAARKIFHVPRPGAALSGGQILFDIADFFLDPLEFLHDCPHVRVIILAVPQQIIGCHAKKFASFRIAKLSGFVFPVS